MKINRARAQNLHDWLHLRKQLWPSYATDQLTSEAKDILSDSEKQICYLIFSDFEPTPFGFIELSLRDSAAGSEGEAVGYVEGWYIAPEYRGQGFGGKLMQEAEAWTKKRGLNKLASDTTDTYASSKTVHLALGFELVKTSYLFIKPLKP